MASPEPVVWVAVRLTDGLVVQLVEGQPEVVVLDLQELSMPADDRELLARVQRAVRNRGGRSGN